MRPVSRLSVTVTCFAVALTAAVADAAARGGGGVASGRRPGAVVARAPRPYGHARSGREGRDRLRDGGFAYGGYGWGGYGFGYGSSAYAVPTYDLIPSRGPHGYPRSVGIPASPVLPPAIYVITRDAGPQARSGSRSQASGVVVVTGLGTATGAGRLVEVPSAR